MALAERLRRQMLYYGGIGREATLIVLASSVSSFYWGVYTVVTGVFFPQVGFTDVQVGSLYSVNGATSALLGIPLSMLSDRYGRKKGMLIGIALVGGSFFIYASTISYFHLLFASFISGLGFGLFFPSSTALLAERTTEAKRTVAFSLSFFVSTATGTLGTAFSIIPAILRSFGVGLVSSYQTIYALTGVIFLFGMIPALFIKESTTTPNGLSLPRKSAGFIVRFSLANILVGLGAGLIIPIFSLWFFIKFRYDETLLAPLNAIATLATALAGLLAPRLADWLGDVPSFLMVEALGICVLLIMPSTNSFPILGVLFVVRQFLANMASPVISSFYMTHVDPNERAAASAISGTSWNFPNSLTPAVGGFLMQNVSVDLPLYLCATSYACSVLLMYRFFYKLRTKPQ
jgi:MFS family permease